MKPRERLLFFPDEEDKYRVNAFHEETYVGCFHTRDFGYFYDRLDRRLQNYLGVNIENVYRHFNGVEKGIQYYTKRQEPKKLAKILWFIRRARFADEQTREPIEFEVEESGKSYIVRYQKLAVGKIYKVFLKKRIYYNYNFYKVNPDIDRFTTSKPGYHSREAKTMLWHWQIDWDLCKFLEVPYCPDPSNVSLNQIRNFTCFRSYDTSILLQSHEDFQDINLRSMIDYLTYREKLRRAEWAAGEDMDYPGTRNTLQRCVQQIP